MLLKTEHYLCNPISFSDVFFLGGGGDKIVPLLKGCLSVINVKFTFYRKNYRKHVVTYNMQHT